jgi:ribosomal protein L11 methyltransferase
MWSIILDIPEKPDTARRMALESALEPFGEAMSSFEAGGGSAWRIEVFSARRPRKAEIRDALLGLCTETAFIARVPDKDWVAESERGLPALNVGPFFVHGSHFKGPAPRQRTGAPRIVFRIDAGVAFGTGRHETTQLCLRALAQLAEKRAYRHPLDLGTGTGILAFAMARLFNCHVLGADNDRDAVRVARENAAINHCNRLVRIVLAERYTARPIMAHAPYDLICANILAGPLIDLAPGLARVLAPRGRAVLSGLLQDQEEAVLDAHRAVGLSLDWRGRRNGWSALVLKSGSK